MRRLSAYRREQQNNSTTKCSQYFAAIAVAVGATAFGTIIAWSTLIDRKLISAREFGFEITDEQFSWIKSSTKFTAASLCILTGYLINNIGRRTTMLLLVLPFTLGWILIIVAQNVMMIIIGRAFLGIACGGICVVVPIYTSEIAEQDIRGMLGSFFQLHISMGIIFVYAVAAFVTTFWLSVICAVIPIVFGVCVLFCPESPTYLVQNNKFDEASTALVWLRGKNYDASAEITEMRLALQEQKQLSGSMITALFRRASLKALFISFGLFFCQQMCGIIVLFTKDIIDSANSQYNSDSLALLVIVLVVVIFLPLFIIDRLGRRTLLLTSQYAIVICMFLLSYYFFMKGNDPNSVDHLNWLSTSSHILLLIAFPLGLGPVPWIMLGELFAPDVKGLAGSLSAASSLTWLFILRNTFFKLRDAYGVVSTLWFFTWISLFGVIFIDSAVPETKGKSLHSIQKMLHKKKIHKLTRVKYEIH